MTPATMLSFDGIEQPITEWALDYGIAPAVIIARLERGLSVKQAIITPMVTARGQKLRGKHIDRYIASQRRAAEKKMRRAKAGNFHPFARPLTYGGETRTLPEWAERFGLSRYTVRTRLSAGWPIEEALTRPTQKRPGVVSNFPPFEGTGAGSTAQEIPEITFSEQAENT